ncbi:MAG: hypothetical protein WC197_09790 [Candidatus Gastranaerophilaceae bacterium]|jgi:hypothetical protein
MKNFFKLLCLTIIFGLFLPFIFQKANAEIVLKSLKSPLSLVLNGNLTIENNKPGEIISFTFPDTVIYENYSIQSGSKFKAELVRINKAKRFNKHGFYEVHLTEFCSSDTNCIKLDDLLKTPLYLRIYQENIQKNKLITNNFIEIVKFSGETALDIILPGVGTGLDCIDSINEEYKKDPQHEKTCIRKVSTGLAEVTYIPLVIRFLSKSPNPEYKEGQIIPVKIKKDAMKKLFVAKPL